ncbi:MAG: LysM peptidoglycan-binding domain-containing protein [Actinomycetota bacterium]|nr:LysM peptidoglycan-binding domain-containing protein [Actinomycetota bacterium]
MNHPRLKCCLRLLCVLAAQAASVLALHRLGRVPFLVVGWHELAWWLRVTPAEDALVAVLRSAALAVAWWLLASTVLCLLARLSGARGAVRLADGLALPVVRRLAQRAAAAGLSAGLVLGPAAARAEPVVVPPDAAAVSTMDDDRSGSHRNALSQEPRSPNSAENDRGRPRPASRISGPPADRQAAAGGRRAVVASQAAGDQPPDPYRVRLGDSLWTIAQQHVAAQRADDSTVAVAGYWVRLVEAAIPSLRSEDPDVIHPGEVITAPPLQRP